MTWARCCLVLTMFAAAASSAAPIFAPALWRDPGPPEQFDFAGTFDPDLRLPAAPFRFLREDPSGTQPKLFVRDANGIVWNVKFGFEVKAESFAWRIVRACGYFVQPNFYVGEGVIVGLPNKLQRPSESVQIDGRFTNARFQPRDPNVRFLPGRSWHWTDNPFRNTPELKGLRILLMLLSNFDNKDSRVGKAGGPNTAMFQITDKRGATTLAYSFTDWGSTMGRWGHLAGQSDWNCQDFTAQSPELVKEVRQGNVIFGFEGHIPEFNGGITPADVHWLTTRLGRITDAQLRAGLAASGATIAEVDCFSKALRARINALLAIANPESR